VNAQPIEITID